MTDNIEIKQGDEVTIISLDHTEARLGVSSEMQSIYNNGILGIVERTSEEDSNTVEVCVSYSEMSQKWYFDSRDLRVSTDETVLEDLEQHLEDNSMPFSVGDIVKLKNPDESPEKVGGALVGFDSRIGRHNATASLRVEGVDEDDKSCFVELHGVGCWVYNKDLGLVEGVNSSPEEITTTLNGGDSIGKKVKLLYSHCYPNRVPCSVSFEHEFGESNLTSTFVCGDYDASDKSYQITNGEGDYCWVYEDELRVVAGEEEQEETLDDVKWIITNESITLSINGQTDSAVIGSPNFEEAKQLILQEDFTAAHNLLNASVGISNWGKGHLQISDGVVTYSGMQLTGKLVDKIITMMADSNSEFESFANFLNLTMEQETTLTRSRLMDFAANDQLSITEEGYVVAFKNVRDDYKDKHSGKFDNSVGNTLSMRRSDVDDNHDVSCSSGLHVCSPNYLSGFWGTSGKTLKVVVNPKNFVAIPYDYKDSKARVCEYTVVEDVTGKIQEYL